MDNRPPTSPPPASRAAALALLATMGMLMVTPPLVQAALELERDGSVFALTLLSGLPTAASLKTFEDALTDRSIVGAAIRPRYAWWMDRLARRGSRKVAIGRGGWLFQREGIAFVCGRDFRDHWRRRRGATAPEEAILDFHRQMTARGIELVVVPVPSKETLHPERLWRRADPFSLPNNPGVSAFVSELRGQGVRVVEVEPILEARKRAGEEAYLPRDTHWTPGAMEAVAGGIAAQVAPLLHDVPPRAFDHRLVDFEGMGDLTRMLSYGATASPYPPMPLLVRQVIGDRRGRPPVAAGDGSVLLLGDSFTNVFASGDPDMGRRGGLGEHLAGALGRPVDVIAMPAGGASRARQALALRPQVLSGKRVVVWQFAERDLRFAEDWRAIAIAETAAVAPEAPVARQVRARVVKASVVPANMAYRSCYVIVAYEDDASGERLFVVHEGWIDGKPQPSLGYRPGDVRRLLLEPAQGHVDLESSCWIETVGMDREPMWALRDDAP